MKFNEQQLQAINCKDRTILCLAGAGAGKTACLVNRVGRLVKDGVDPTSILVLTFTNAAAFEMAERFKTSYPDCPRIPEFRTFHSFAYSLLAKDKDIRAKLKYTKVPDICEDAEYKQIMTDAKLKLNTPLSMEMLQGDIDPNWTMKQKNQYNMFYLLVNKMLRAQNLITFDKLSSTMSQLFSSKDPCIQKYLDKYNYILVDEFQDSDDEQMAFLNSFPETANFYFCGDALQNIYSFRGTSNKYIKMLSMNPDWTVIRLFQNYRSTNQICKFANKMSHYADPSYRIEMKGQRDGDEVEVIYNANSNYIELVDNEHMHKLVQKLKVLKEGGAILCRTNKEVAYVKDRLKQEKIPYVSKLQNNDEPLKILRGARDHRFAVTWLASQLSTNNYVHFVRMTQVSPVSVKQMMETFPNDSTIMDLGQRILEIHSCLSLDSMPYTKLNNIAKSLNVFVTPLPMEEANKLTVDELLDYIEKNIQDQIESQLYVGTIHSSKGLEYDHVFLMGVGDRSFPLDSEDMRNLYYVGCTRAKNHLTVFRR